jgi:transcriptional regulator with XRE-family HTH domain
MIFRVPTKPSSNTDDRSFWEVVLANFRERNWAEEPRVYKDFRIALEAIRKRSGLKLEEIAVRVGVTYSALMGYDARKGSNLSPELCARFRTLAMRLDLPKLALWFEQQEGVRQRKNRRRDQPITGKLDREYES